MDVNLQVRDAVRKLRGYESDSDPGLRMDMNTNLIAVNPAIGKVLSRLSGNEIIQYPDSGSDKLRAVISQFFSLKPGNILVGNGTNEILDIVMKTFIGPGDTVAVPRPTFSMYAFYATLAHGKILELPLTKDFQLPDEFFTVKSKLTIIPSPSNPTGNCFPEPVLKNIIEKSNLVLLDEIYADYCRQDFMKKVKDYDNFIVTRTFSKAYGMAGMRIGYCAADEKIIDMMSRVKPPFSVNTVAQMVALEAIKNQKFLKKVVDITMKERDFLFTALKKRGFKTVPPDANFLFTKSPIDSKFLTGSLKKKHIHIKDFGHLVKGYVRITVGTRKMNEMLISAIDECMKNK